MSTLLEPVPGTLEDALRIIRELRSRLATLERLQGVAADYLSRPPEPPAPRERGLRAV